MADLKPSADLAALIKKLHTVQAMCAELEEEVTISQRAFGDLPAAAVRRPTSEVAVIVAGRRVRGLGPTIKALNSAWETYERSLFTPGERQAYLNLNLRLNALQAALKGA